MNIDKNRIDSIECMLVVLYKKLDDIERKLKGSSRSAPLSSYFKDLKKDADKLKKDLQEKGLLE